MSNAAISSFAYNILFFNNKSSIAKSERIIQKGAENAYEIEFAIHDLRELWKDQPSLGGAELHSESQDAADGADRCPVLLFESGLLFNHRGPPQEELTEKKGNENVQTREKAVVGRYRVHCPWIHRYRRSGGFQQRLRFDG